MKFALILSLVFGFWVADVSLFAQRGDMRDQAGQQQIDLIPLDKVPPQPVLSPEESLAAFKLQAGFHIELVASEPLIHDPIAITFAPDGRIWVVEMTSYMPNVDGVGEGAPTGKIVILESSHHDGHLDSRVVFADHLSLPRAVALVRDGVLVGEPPHLWFYSIVDGNKAGKRVELAKDFGSNYNPQNTANGLMWGLDNWIYCASYTTRLRNTDGEWQFGPTTRRGEWGISQDNYGRLIYNSNEDQFRIDLVNSYYLQRNPNHRHALGINVDPIHDQTVWPIHMTTGVNRGYWKDILRPDGTLAKTTAACGPLIYRGDNFPPEYRGNAFVCEPAGNLVMRDILSDTNGIVSGREVYAHEEFLASTDERFRPTSLYNGPDGAMYLVDFHRGALEHRLSVTTYLRRQIKSRHLEEPLHMGRIYRITYGTNVSPRPTLEDLSSAQLVEKLASPRGWVQDTAQRLLVERANPNVIDSLKAQAVSVSDPVAQIHTAWTLDGMGQMDRPTLFTLLTNSHPKVRAAAVRLAESFFHRSDKADVLEHLQTVAETDSDPDVQLQLALSFGEAGESGRAGLGIVAAHNSVPDRPLVTEGLLSSMNGYESEYAQYLLSTSRSLQAGDYDLLKGLAECIINSRDTNHIAKMFSGLPDRVPHVLDAVLALKKSRKIYFAAEPAEITALRGNPKLVKKIDQLSHLLAWPGQAGYVPPPYVPPLTAEESKAFELGRNLFNSTCAACHQPTGLGAAGVAPPLVESEWVLGTTDRLIRIVLQGVQGPIHAAGAHFDSTMPSWNTFNDEQLAGILTYIRRNWEQGASPVVPASVRAIRAATIGHEGAWTSDDLLKIQ